MCKLLDIIKSISEINITAYNGISFECYLFSLLIQSRGVPYKLCLIIFLILFEPLTWGVP